MARIINIEGIGETYAERLQELGIRTTDRLLKVAADRRGRKDLAEASGISESLILKWVNRADLMRIRGIGEEYSDLLELAGVDTIKELRNRNPANLYQALVEQNKKRKVVRRLPSRKQVERWVEEAKRLRPMVRH